MRFLVPIGEFLRSSLSTNALKGNSSRREPACFSGALCFSGLDEDYSPPWNSK